jgi:hypothetical protein
MKYLVIAALAIVVACAGCVQKSALVPSGNQEVLRKILDPRFVLTSVPKKREADLYEILEVFAAGRRPDQLVCSVEFSSDSEASLSFSDSGMHGGGVAYLKKKERRWVVDEKWHAM